MSSSLSSLSLLLLVVYAMLKYHPLRAGASVLPRAV